MKHYINIVLIIVLATIGLFLNLRDEIRAESGAIEISPALNIVEPGESVTIKVTNTTDRQIEVKIYPIIINFGENRSDFELVSNESINPSEYVSVPSDNLLVSAGSSQEFSVTYIKAIADFVTGVSVEQVSNGKEKIATDSAIVSLLLDYTIAESDLKNIDTQIASYLSVSLVDIEFNNKFNLETTILNDSTKIVKPTGEIGVYEGDVKLGNISLTQKIKNSLLPGESVVVSSEFIDSRDPWDRMGKITFVQQINLQDFSLMDEIEIFVFPYQVVLYLFILLILFIIGIRIFYIRRRSKNTKYAQKKNNKNNNIF